MFSHSASQTLDQQAHPSFTAHYITLSKYILGDAQFKQAWL